MSDSLEKLLVGVACLIIGAGINEFIHRRRTKTALVSTVADRYIPEARTGADTPAFRLSLMQRAGIALLSHRQIKAFIHEVTGRGCTHPFKDSDIESSVSAKDLPAFVRACSERGYLLTTDQTVPVAMANLIHDGENKKGKKGAE